MRELSYRPEWRRLGDVAELIFSGFKQKAFRGDLVA